MYCVEEVFTIVSNMYGIMRIFTKLSRFITFTFLTSTFLVGCEEKDNPDLVPSYIHIEQIDLISNYNQGTASHKITDAWVYADETLIGAFELPATVPILRKGQQKITIRPGIKINGIANTRSIYPFYSTIERTLNLVQDSVITISDAVVTYKSNVDFPWLENFDLTGITLDTTAKSTVGIIKSNDPAILFGYKNEDNNYSALIRMTGDTAVFEATTIGKYDFPGNGAAVFLEMNYKANQTMVVGVIYLASGIRVQRPLLYLNKTDEWKKIYVNLTVPKYDTPSATDFQIFFGAQKEEGLEESLIALDNLKLVHFNISK